MRVGDVVLRMKGRVIDDADTLRDVAEAAEPGDVIPVLVLRQQGNAARRSYITLRVPEEDWVLYQNVARVGSATDLG